MAAHVVLDGVGKEAKFCNSHFHMWLEKREEIIREAREQQDFRNVFGIPS